jgi:hypothetical protein
MSNAVTAQDNNDTHEASHAVEISIPTVALVDVEGSDGEVTSITLKPDVSALEAGEAVNFGSATNSDLWLNYTSIVGSDQTRDITAALDGTLPSGVSLNLAASGVSTGNGALGNAAGQISLSASAQNLITGIGSGYTESGYKKGHQLTYTLDMDNGSYEDLVADDYDVTVMFTITGE